MELLNYLQSIIEDEKGYVQVALAKEDIKRVKELISIANEVASEAEMVKAGLYIGWTKGDFRTHELHKPLKALLRSIYEFENGAKTDEQNNLIMDHWTELHLLRISTLIHCL